VHAAAHEVPDARFGITSVLDFAERVPAGFEATVVSALDPAGLLEAARATARLLHETGELLPEDQRAALPHAMGAYITADLDSLDLEKPAT
jgi:hypothetical protein